MKSDSGSASVSETPTPLSREEELEALIAEQAKDDQWGDRVRSLSLDARIGGADDAGTYYELHGQADTELVALTGDGEATAVRRIPRPQTWTRHQIIRHIRQWVREHGEVPYYNDWNRPNGRGIPSSASVARKFGSFSEGIHAAGFQPRRVGGLRNLNPGGEKSRPRIKRRRYTARLTSEQIAAAYVLYDREGLDLTRLGERLWERYGYPSARLCSQALRVGFYSDGFTLRTKSEARLNLAPERRRAIAIKAGMARAKLTPQQVIEIRRSRARQCDIAARYGVSQSTISRIKLRTSWGPMLFTEAA